jgi:heat-inducible transcriptional repressor
MNEQRQEPLDGRKAAILQAIVAHYVRSGEPVGSKTLVERFPLQVSAATVRNEMAALEELGLIFQPHTSAGRIPTDAGYRFYVDEYGAGGRLSPPEARRVRSFFGSPHWELEDALRETASLLCNLTSHAAVVFAPALDRSVVRHVELVGLGAERVMVVVVTNTGRVENHIVPAPEGIDDVHLNQGNEMLNRILVGAQLESAGRTIQEATERFPLELRELVTNVGRVLGEQLSKPDEDRVFLEGTSNMVDEAKFSDLETVREVIGALEHRRLLLELLADALEVRRVTVSIGSENAIHEMQRCAVVTAAYGDEGNVMGSLGVVGPTRMDYRRTMAAVNEVASYLGRMLTDTAP